jgi:hypothetical protein
MPKAIEPITLKNNNGNGGQNEKPQSVQSLLESSEKLSHSLDWARIILSQVSEVSEKESLESCMSVDSGKDWDVSCKLTKGQKSILVTGLAHYKSIANSSSFLSFDLNTSLSNSEDIKHRTIGQLENLTTSNTDKLTIFDLKMKRFEGSFATNNKLIYRIEAKEVKIFTVSGLYSKITFEDLLLINSDPIEKSKESNRILLSSVEPLKYNRETQKLEGRVNYSFTFGQKEETGTLILSETGLKDETSGEAINWTCGGTRLCFAL